MIGVGDVLLQGRRPRVPNCAETARLWLLFLSLRGFVSGWRVGNIPGRLLLVCLLVRMRIFLIEVE